MAFDGNQARFTVNGLPSEDASGNRGVVVANAALVTLQLETIPSGVLSATFQVYDATDPSSPLASLSAPALTFTGTGLPLELLTDPDTQTSTFTFPAVGIEAYLVRCTVSTSGGPVVFERIVASRGIVSALRKTIPAESQEFESRGWSDELNRMVDALELGGGTADTTEDEVTSTSDATPKTIVTYATLANDRAIDMKIRVWCIEPSTGDIGKWLYEPIFLRDNVGAITERTPVMVYQPPPGIPWDATILIAAPNISVQVTGEAGKDLEWRCQIEVNEHG